ncbi:hypothetical protein ACFY1L_52075 [Streptomyces sp. NPDC001663]|uniref:hypothetical protein n=1 Tax=Streptomyces sp. NPDC001663 TaxID=3364597 RepID=UPI00367F4A5C
MEQYKNQLSHIDSPFRKASVPALPYDMRVLSGSALVPGVVGVQERPVGAVGPHDTAYNGYWAFR